MTIKISPDYIVVTDLDGTLLDHDDYSWHAAKPALDYLALSNTPIVFNTSKTLNEVIVLQRDIGIDAPFVVENGSALYMPKSWLKHVPMDMEDSGHYWTKTFGCSKADIVLFLAEMRQRYQWQFEGYSDWTDDDIASHTGLSGPEVEQSKSRGYSEPLLWLDTDANFKKFQEEVSISGFNMLQGGRFTHVLGRTDKGVPLQWLKSFFKKEKNRSIDLICLGDSPNDIAMLDLADIPVIVNSPRGMKEYSDVNESVMVTEGYGPIGWNQAISKIFKIE